ncbi:MAG: glycosyltransferase family protein [Deltaproteobacteria bacterium]|nr:glycosyltransferase family protein [Deltaproteobacteria bacterium]
MPLERPVAAPVIEPVIAIVQARMSSTRLPSKVMKPVCGRPILWHVVNRLKSSEFIDETVIATTTEASDDIIEEWCTLHGIRFYRGSLNDVLDRYYQAAKEFGARTIVRVTSDCPLIDPALVDRAIKKFSEGSFDHVSIDPSFPDGLDAEVFSFDALAKAHREAALASEREHVTPYIWKNPEVFRLHKIKSPRDLSRMRWTVDDEKDLMLVTKIFEGMGPAEEVFHCEDILRFLESRPDLLKINSDTARNEGYARSLKQDAAAKRIA